ncbi:MAG: hypothetical protein E6K96_09640 [Thaumarchaeota archaeon]|nr:MAG: hypothetical protein E6K96_09640 [Nitrososphaerota archaeon]
MAQTDNLTDEDLGDTLLDVGINWEHFVASTNNILIPDQPLKITDSAMQAKIDSLDLITEALVAEVNLRSLQKRGESRDRGRIRNLRGATLGTQPGKRRIIIHVELGPSRLKVPEGPLPCREEMRKT